MYATALCGIRAGSFPLIPFDLFLIHVLIIVRTYRLPTLRAVKHLLHDRTDSTCSGAGFRALNHKYDIRPNDSDLTTDRPVWTAFCRVVPPDWRTTK
jgi:hypothetical protein